jgi:hypothetical protein
MFRSNNNETKFYIHFLTQKVQNCVYIMQLKLLFTFCTKVFLFRQMSVKGQKLPKKVKISRKKPLKGNFLFRPDFLSSSPKERLSPYKKVSEDLFFC